LNKGQTVTLPVSVTAITVGPIESTVRVSGTVFDPNLQNNTATASTDPSKCKGQTIRRTAPLSVLYEPTATAPAVKIIAAQIQNVGARSFEIVTLDPFPDQPFTVTGILPPLPFIIDSGATASFEVRTERAAGLTPPEAFAPYFQLTSRCGS
jgi:hypothetical protein